MTALLLYCAVLVVLAIAMGSPSPQRPLPYELETYFTNEEWYTELTRDEQDEWCAKINL